MKRLIREIVIAMIGAVILGIVIYGSQMKVTINRQHDNSQLKLDIASQRYENYNEEAQDNWNRYDSFSQAKADVLSYFYSRNPEALSDIVGMAYQWDAKNMYVVDDNLKMIASNDNNPGEVIYGDSDFENLIRQNIIFTRDHIRYYKSEMNNGGYVVIGRDVTDYENAQEELTSYEYEFDTIRVGTGGFIVAVDDLKDEIVYSKDQTLVGQNASLAGIKDQVSENGYMGWTTLNGISYHAESRTVGDIVLIAMLPKSEIAEVDMKTVVVALLVYVMIISSIIVYMNECRHENLKKRQILKKAQSAVILCLLVASVITFAAQSLLTLSRQSVKFTTKLDDINQIISVNEERLTSLTDEYNEEYSRKALNLAYLFSQDPSMINDEILLEVASRAQVKAIYVFDGTGTAIATNTVYKGFALSQDKDDQSYEFWNIIKGYVRTVVQQATQDNTALHEYIQYIGTKRLDADGIVQLGISPQRLENRIKTTQLNYILNNIAVENHGYSFAVDKTSRELIYSPEEKYIGRDALEYGLDESAMEDGYAGYQTILGNKCYVSCLEYGNELIYVAAPLDTVAYGRSLMTALVTGLTLLTSLIVIFMTVHEAQKEETSEEAAIVNNTVEARTTKYIGIFMLILSILLVLFVALDGSNQPMLKYILSKKWQKEPSIFSLSYIAFIFIVVIISSVFVRKILSILMFNMGAKTKTIGKLLSNFIKYFAVIGTVFYCLNFLGVNISTLLASAGLLTLIIGLGAQSLVGDIIAGIFIVFEGEFQVGDVITVDGWRGTVLEIGIRSTQVKDPSNNIKIINNSDIKGVVNMTQNASFAFCDVGIEYDESLERVETILGKELPRFKERIPGIQKGPYYKGVVSLADSCVVIRIIVQCDENDKIQLTRDLNREVKLLFDRNNINIPFPQVVVNQRKEEKVETKKQEYMDRVEAEKFVNEQREVSKDVRVNGQ